MTGGGDQFISIQPEELKFQVELDKQSYCDLKVANNTEHHVAFKVKTTSPKKYFVRPNTGVIHPWDSCIIRVTLQAQREYPLDMQCKDKFLLQSTIVPPQTELDNLPADTFSKESGKTIEECKLKVVYSIPGSAQDSDDETSESAKRIPESNAVQRLKDERDAIIQQSHHLQQELELLKKRRNRPSDPGFSFKFAMLVGFIGLMVGFLTKLLISSPAAPTASQLQES